MPWKGAAMLRIPQLCELAYSEQTSCPGSQCYAASTREYPATIGCPTWLGGNIPYIGCGPSTTKLGLLWEIGQRDYFWWNERVSSLSCK